MEIIFFKRLGSKNIISFKRDGLKEEWIEADNFLILHDLSHYIIETTLKFKKAFWGLIKEGANPKDFEDKGLREKLLISNEAWYAECMANLFLMEYHQGRFENFNEVLSTCILETNRDLPEFEINPIELNSIRIQYAEIIERWKKLPQDGKLILPF